MARRIRIKDLKAKANRLMDTGADKLDQVQAILDGIVDMLEDIEENGLELTAEILGREMPLKLKARPADDPEEG